MMHRVLLVLAIFLSFNSYAVNVGDAASIIVKQTNRNDKCKVFFDYFMKYLEKGDSGKANSLILALDEKEPGLVDYCDVNRHKYL